MDPIICIRRTAIAQDRIDALAAQLAGQAGVELPKPAFDRDPAVLLMNRMEAIVQFLEAIAVQRQADDTLRAISLIDGIGEATMSKIRNGLVDQGVLQGG